MEPLGHSKDKTMLDTTVDDLEVGRSSTIDNDLDFFLEKLPSLSQCPDLDRVRTAWEVYHVWNLPEELHPDSVDSSIVHFETESLYKDAVYQLILLNGGHDDASQKLPTDQKGKRKERLDNVMFLIPYETQELVPTPVSEFQDGTQSTADGPNPLDSKTDMTLRCADSAGASTVSRSRWGLKRITEILGMQIFGQRSETSASMHASMKPRLDQAFSSSTDVGLNPSAPHMSTGSKFQGYSRHVFEKRECASCMETTVDADSAKLSCKHVYCRSCFGQMIVTLSQNEAQWPPRCCLIQVPRSILINHLEPEQLAIFHEKEREYSVKAANRWYCTNVPGCGKFFIPKKGGSGVTSCTHCAHSMCIMCRGPAHRGLDLCSEDRALRATLDKANAEGWRTCPGCSAIIEHVAGCRHMTCICGFHFCYVCLAKWRTCSCSPDDLFRYLTRPRPSVTSSRKTSKTRDDLEEQWRLARVALDRILSEHERVDEEMQQEEVALAAVAALQRADFDVRAKLEQDEASKMEHQRLKGIEIFSKTLQSDISRLFESLQGKLVSRHEKALGAYDACIVEVKQLLLTANEKKRAAAQQHGIQLGNLRKQHSEDMEKYKARVKSMITLEAMSLCMNADTESALDFTLRLYEAAALFFEELNRAQTEQSAFLQTCHQRMLERITSKTQTDIRQTCTDFLGSVSQMNGLTDHTEIDTDFVSNDKNDYAMRVVADLKWLQIFQGLVEGLRLDKISQLVASGADPSRTEILSQVSTLGDQDQAM